MINNEEVVRGILFVPAYKKYLDKIEQMDITAIIIDLEDSVAKDDKDQAFQSCIDFVKNYQGNKKIYVRVNFERAEYEISQLQEYNVEGFMFPKLETAKDIPAVCCKKIIGLVETPKGVIDVERYICDDRIVALAFGAEDYSSLVECKNCYSSLFYPKSKLVTYAKAYNKKIYDTVFTDVHNDEAFRNAVTQSKDLGFDGRLLIHPSQIKIVDEVYNDVDYDFMSRVIDLYNHSETGVVYINNQIYERPHIEYFKKKIEEKEDDACEKVGRIDSQT